MTVYPRRVKKGSDGIYRWSYDEALTFSNPMFARSLAMGAIIGILACAIILFINRSWLMWALLAVVAMVLLPTIVWMVNIKILRIHVHGEYEMGDDYINIVRALDKERHEFKNVKSIIVNPRHDLIEIKDSAIGATIMVNEKDIDMVQGFIKSHATNATIKTK